MGLPEIKFTAAGDMLIQRIISTGYSLLTNHKMPEAVIPYFVMKDGGLTHLELLPIELGFDEPGYRMGNPKVSFRHGIIERYAEMSRPYGTEIKINEDGIGVVELG